MGEFSIHHVSVSRSTNLDAVELIASGNAHGRTVIVADAQTDGSGRRGRSWLSPKGNLYFSVILKEQIGVAPLSFIASLAVGGVLEQIFDKHGHSAKKALIKYKWPNDVLVDGKKISGTLIQAKIIGNTTLWAVCGVGVNICIPPLPHSTSISDHVPGLKLSNIELLDMTLERMKQLLDVFSTAGFAQLRILWMKRAHDLGNRVRIVASSGAVTEGRFVDIDMLGAMVIKPDNGTLTTVSHGEML
ncbi:MAG: biotin--[acetyl-CoA-carboxylase] ligase [Anaplasma sp.]